MGRHEGAFAVASGAASSIDERHAIVDFLRGYSVETSPAAADRRSASARSRASLPPEGVSFMPRY